MRTSSTKRAAKKPLSYHWLVGWFVEVFSSAGLVSLCYRDMKCCYVYIIHFGDIELPFISTQVLVLSWLFWIQNNSCLVSFWCMLRVGVEV